MRPRMTPKARNKRTTDPADAVSKRCGRTFFIVFIIFDCPGKNQRAVILLPKTYAYSDLKALLDEIGPLDLERQQPETDQARDFG